jgi:hypothetical protein
MKKKINVVEHITWKLGDELINVYNKQFLDIATQSLSFGPRLKIIGYRKVKVPVYFEIDVPVTERHYDEDGEYEGMLTRMEKKRLFKIGTKIEERPIYEKPKPSKATIKFKRYSPLIQEKLIKKQINKLKIK